MISKFKTFALFAIIPFGTISNAHANEKDITNDVEELIADGVPAQPKNWEFFTQLRVENIDENEEVISYPLCGGSYIGQGYVLTAAHCLNNIPASFISVRIGAYTQDGDDGVKVGVSKVYIHPFYKNFEGKRAINDIALLKLDEIPKDVKAIELATKSVNDYVSPGDLLHVAGFGRTEESDKYPDHLLSVKVPYISKSKCDYAHRDKDHDGVGKGAFCAVSDWDDIIKRTCGGDSGGPIVVRQNGEVVQLGVVSWGLECFEPAPEHVIPNKYDVYADVAALETFIDAIMNIKEP